MDLVGLLRDWRRVGKAEVDMEVGAEVVEAKEEVEEEEEKKEKKEKEKKDNKIGVAEKVSTIAMPGAGLLLLFWGLQRGYPLWTCFLAFFNKGFIRKSAVW